MPTAWAIGAGAGLASMAGVRSFIPLAIYMLFARLGWVWGFSLENTPMDFLLSNAAAVVLLVAVAAQIAITRLPAMARIDLLLRMPLAVLVGALIMAGTLAGVISSSLYLVGLPVGAVLALLGAYVYQGLVMAGGGRDPGPALDVSLIIVSSLTMLAPPAGYLVLLLGVWLALRVRRLKRMKYKGLRVLA